MAEEKWVCTLCGYVHEGPLPDDFICPICGAGADVFVKQED
jgi:rubrerythrin